MSFSGLWSQLFPPKPTFTEENLPDQTGKIVIVTGGNSGVGFELVKILYTKGAKVYMAARIEAKAREAIDSIVKTTAGKEGLGEIKYLHLDLADLATIKKSAVEFSAQEKKLDILWNNAGVAAMPAHLKTEQGYEMHMGTNCLGPFLFTQLLNPKLRAAAKSAPKDTVRVTWTSSISAEADSPQGGVDFKELLNPTNNSRRNYATSKVGNWFLAVEFARKFESDGVVSIALNPGNLKTPIWNGTSKLVQIAMRPTMSPVIFGAYTNMWAGLSPEITVAAGTEGGYVVPWGRFYVTTRKDLLSALKEEDGSEFGGQAGKFWNWCDEQTKRYT